MNVEKTETIPLRVEQDMVRCRQSVRQRALELKLSLIDQTKIVTAASEIARNTLIYGGGGHVTIETVSKGLKRGLRLIFQDNGPGIPDIEKALGDGYTSGNGLGLGLGGAKRLSSEFEVISKVGEGTKVVLIRWK